MKSKRKTKSFLKIVPLDHTKRAYLGLSDAYAHFNRHLFQGKLPTCLITMQRKKNMRGYFWKGKFQNGNRFTDELALNPSEYNGRKPDEILSTLVHEMCHVWQHHLGNPPKSVWHSKEWAEKMKEIGLYPSHTGKPGGKEVGQKMSHYILKNGKFADVCAKFLALGTLQLYSDAFGDQKLAKKKAESKTKYTCDECGVNAWAKPDTNLICGDCDCAMISENETTSKQLRKAA